MRSKTGVPQGYGTTSRKSLGERTIHENSEVTMHNEDYKVCEQRGCNEDAEDGSDFCARHKKNQEVK